MSYNNLRYDTLEAIHKTILDMSLPITAENIVMRKTFLADGLTLPCIIISPVMPEPVQAPAGRRARYLNNLVSCYFLGNEDPSFQLKEQLYVVDTIETAFQLTILDGVDQINQCTVVPGDSYLPAAYRNNIDTIRLVIKCETCERLADAS